MYYSLLVTFVWWVKGFSNVSMYFHWSTLRFAHFNCSKTVVKCSYTSTIRHMTRINESHRLHGQCLTGFFQLAVSSTLLLYPHLFTLFTMANALFTHRIYAGAVSKTFTTNCNVCTKQSNRQMLLPDLSHITYQSFLLQTHVLLDLEIIPLV